MNIPAILFFGWLIGVTVMYVLYNPKAITDKETGGQLYCSQKCIEMLFVHMVLIWTIIGINLILIFILYIVVSIKFKNAKKSENTDETMKM